MGWDSGRRSYLESCKFFGDTLASPAIVANTRPANAGREFCFRRLVEGRVLLDTEFSRYRLLGSGLRNSRPCLADSAGDSIRRLH
jgi:hypothetical protein